MSKPDLCNVYAIDLNTKEKELIAANKTQQNAEAIQSFAVSRQGVSDRYFTIEPVVQP